MDAVVHLKTRVFPKTWLFGDKSCYVIAVCLPDDFHPCPPISSSIPVKMKENSLQLLTGTLQNISDCCHSLQSLPVCVAACGRDKVRQGDTEL